MELLSVYKQYRKCILRENAKLKSIYNRLLREAEEDVTGTNECDVKEAELSDDELDDIAAITGNFYRGSSSNAGGGTTGIGGRQGDKMNKQVRAQNPEDFEIHEDEMMTADEFFGAVSEDEENADEDGTKKDVKECDASKDKEIEEEEEEEVSETNEMMTAKEFFGEVSEADEEIDEDDEDVKECEETEKLIDKNRKLFQRK